MEESDLERYACGLAVFYSYDLSLGSLCRYPGQRRFLRRLLRRWSPLVTRQRTGETAIGALDDSGSAKHAVFEEEARRAQRQMQLDKAGKEGRIQVRILADCKRS